MSPLTKILVVGGNGFVGSAVCRAALARGMQVTSISSSGKPYTTPKGHSPAWTSKVDWQKGDALQPESYAHLLPGVTGVVHTIGTLLENTRYKAALRDGNVPGLIGSLAADLLGNSSGNPLEADRDKKGTYELLNRDSAIRVCETFMSTKPDVKLDAPRPFVYLSAEDCGRPFIPARYIEAKREAELALQSMISKDPHYRGVYIRPSLIYHAHYRPLTSPAATLADISATIHSHAPRGFPTPAGILRALGSAFPPPTSSTSHVAPSPLMSLANTLTIPPIHVDHVAEAICIALDPARPDIRGVIGVQQMRELIGWAQKGQPQQTASPSASARV